MFRVGRSWRMVALLSCAVGGSLALAQDVPPPATHGHSPGVIFSSPLADVPGKHLAVVALEWDPKAGQHSTPHRHPGSVYVYVTKGAAKLGIEGQPVRVVHAGESFFEPPGALHTVAESASATEPASAIAVMIVPDGAPLATPEPPKKTTQQPSGQERAEVAGRGLVGTPAPKLVLTTLDGGKIPIVIDDGRLGTAFNLRVTPEHIVIGRDGRIQYIGHLADQRLEAELVGARAPALGSISAPATVSTDTRGDPPHGGVGDRLPDISVATLDGSHFKIFDPSARRATALVFMSPSEGFDANLPGRVQRVASR